LGFTVRALRLKGEESGGFLHVVIGFVGETESTASDVTAADADPGLKRRSAVVALAGREGRRLKYPDSAQWSDLEANDRSRAAALLHSSGQEDQIDAVASEARSLVTQHSNAIGAVAALLANRGVPSVVAGDEVREILRARG
jgi:hypothetical protein